MLVLPLQEEMISLEAFSGILSALRFSLIPSRQPRVADILSLSSHNSVMGTAGLELVEGELGYLLSW